MILGRRLFLTPSSSIYGEQVFCSLHPDELNETRIHHLGYGSFWLRFSIYGLSGFSLPPPASKTSPAGPRTNVFLVIRSRCMTFQIDEPICVLFLAVETGETRFFPLSISTFDVKVR